MKFFVSTNPISSSQSPQAEILMAAKQWLEEKLEDNTFECVYTTIPRGGLMIANADTAEELWDILISYPLYQYLNIKVSPLVDFKHVFDKTLKMINS